MSAWDWTEVTEGIVVSLVFVLLPILWRMERHHKQTMAAHRRTHEHLGIGKDQ
jgi:hypothetical protein